jgi:aryl-alcohol dehydrogenase-like predicted oxidoreductase
MKSLILGTANFGGTYGISSQKKISTDSIEQILSLAQDNGINHFDTAKSYGDAEIILGKFLDKSQSLFIDSKIALPECESVNSIVDAVNQSLSVLGIPKLNTLYLHNADLLSGNNSLIIQKGMEKVLDLGLADNLGVSVYTFKQLKEVNAEFPLLSTFQILENICDRRLIYLKELVDFTNKGNVVNIRSVFLQGLLLMSLKNLPDKFQRAKHSIVDLNKYAIENHVNVLDLCIAYVKKIPWVSNYLVGVESPSQLREILESSFELKENWETQISQLPEELKDPRFW